MNSRTPERIHVSLQVYVNISSFLRYGGVFFFDLFVYILFYFFRGFWLLWLSWLLWLLWLLALVAFVASVVFVAFLAFVAFDGYLATLLPSLSLSLSLSFFRGFLSYFLVCFADKYCKQGSKERLQLSRASKHASTILLNFGIPGRACWWLFAFDAPLATPPASTKSALRGSDKVLRLARNEYFKVHSFKAFFLSFDFCYLSISVSIDPLICLSFYL